MEPPPTPPPLRVGQSVEVTGRGLRGRIGYVGPTNFADGCWVGVELDEERGKNNGCVQGVSYFRCAPNCGLFVRAAQLTIIQQAEAAAAETAREEAEEEEPEKEEAKAESKSKVENDVEKEKEIAKCLATASSQLLKTTRINQPKPFLSSSSQSSLAVVATAVPTAPKRSKTSVSPSESFCCAKRASFVETGFLEILQPQFTPGKPLRSPIFSTTSLRSTSDANCDVSSDDGHGHGHGSVDGAHIGDLGDELAATLKPQRVVDQRCRFGELEKVRNQNKQLLEFKAKILEQQGQLQRNLQRCKQEVRDADDARAKWRRELTELSESVALLTHDKEIAEERAELLQIELELAQRRIEEFSLNEETVRAGKMLPLPLPSSPASLGNLRRLEQGKDDSIVAEVTDNFVPAEQPRSKFFLINNNFTKIKNFLLNYYSL